MIVSSRQSLFDLALQYGGAFESAFDIAEANGISMTDDLETGQELNLPHVRNSQVAQYYSVGNLQPATGATSDELNTVLGIGEGVGFWAIEYNFIIQ